MNRCPQRILFLKPDTYGDLILFESALRIVSEALPEAEVAVLIQKQFLDITALFDSKIRWLTISVNPQRTRLKDQPHSLQELEQAIRDYRPDCVVAACVNTSWLEAAAAFFSPEALHICNGPFSLDPIDEQELKCQLGEKWLGEIKTLYPEFVCTDDEPIEWKKNLKLVSHLTDNTVSQEVPGLRIPDHIAEDANRILAEHQLSNTSFVACGAAGIANVTIKAWPKSKFGDLISWLEKEKGIRTLLIGHHREKEWLEEVRNFAQQSNANPALWLGNDGQMPLLAGLLASAKLYVGNDTGAMHLASALGTDLVGIFGGGHWPRFVPACKPKSRAIAISQPLPCFGCAWDCFFNNAPCVSTIPSSTVKIAIEQLLEKDGTRGVTQIYECAGLTPESRNIIEQVMPHFRIMQSNNENQYRQIHELTLLLRQCQDESLDRYHQIQTLTGLLKESEIDRQAKLEVINRFIEINRSAIS